MNSDICIPLVVWERVSMLFIHLILHIAAQPGQFQQLLKTRVILMPITAISASFNSTLSVLPEGC